jgi:hypothetical protein
MLFRLKNRVTRSQLLDLFNKKKALVLESFPDKIRLMTDHDNNFFRPDGPGYIQ